MLGAGTSDELRVAATASATRVCPGECTDIRALVTGGRGEYEYSWNQGLPASAGPFHVCPSQSTVYTVSVRERPGAEIRSSQSLTASVAVTVGSSCAGPSSPGAGGGSASSGASGASSGGSSWGGSAGVPPTNGSGGSTGAGGSTPAGDGGQPPPGVLDPHCRARFLVTSGNKMSVPVDTVGGSLNGSSASPNVTTDASGNIVIAGSFDGTIDTGAGVLDAQGASSAGFVVKLDAECRPAWARSYGSDGGSVFAGPVAIDSMGAPVLAGGVIAASIDFGTGLEPTNDTSVHPFLLKLRPDGTTLFVKHYLGDGTADVAGVAVDAADDILLMGGGFGLSFGGPTLDSSLGADFVVKLEADATHVWTRTGPKKSSFHTMCATRSGFVYLIGQTHVWLLVGTTLTDTLGNPGNTNFMTAFDANGNQPFTTSIQPPGGQNWGVTCGATPQETAEVAYGNGDWMDPMAVRGLRMVSPDGTTTPVVEWGVQGELSMAGWLDVDGARNTVEVGTVMMPIHVGGITITPPRNANGDSLDDIYVVKRDPGGAVLRAGRIGASSPEATTMDFRYAPLGATVDADGNLVIDYVEKNPDGSYTLTVAKYAL